MPELSRNLSRAEQSSAYSNRSLLTLLNVTVEKCIHVCTRVGYCWTAGQPLQLHLQLYMHSAAVHVL